MNDPDPFVTPRFVGKRTVYSYAEIVEMCNHKEVLAIRFRTVCPLEPKITLQTLRSNDIIKSQPQSIASIALDELGYQPWTAP